jgi:hypothetical protein
VTVVEGPTIPPPRPVPPVLNITRRSDGTYEISVTGTQGRAYVLEASNDLRTWTLVTTCVSGNQPFQFGDQVVPNSPPRFYRVLSR